MVYEIALSPSKKHPKPIVTHLSPKNQPNLQADALSPPETASPCFCFTVFQVEYSSYEGWLFLVRGATPVPSINRGVDRSIKQGSADFLRVRPRDS